MDVRVREFSLKLYRFAMIEPVILGVALLLGLMLWAFFGIAGEMLEGDTLAFDRHILMLMREPSDITKPLGPPWLGEMMRDFSALGGVALLTMVTLASAAYLVIHRKTRTALYLVSVIATGMVLSNLLKHGYARPRPDFMVHDAVVYTASFPSGHSMMSAVVYLTLGSLLARAQPGIALKSYLLGLAVFLTVLVGISRLYLGVHWPSDVLAGWIAGAACALVFWSGAHLLARNAMVEQEET